MKNKTWLWITIAVIVILFLYNRQQVTAPENDTKPATNQTVQEDRADTDDTLMMNDIVTTNEEIDESGSGSVGFVLSGEALGNGMVKLMWALEESDNLPKDARFVLIRGTDKNPMHDGTNHWYRVFHTVMETTWQDQPMGTFRYRVCQTDEKDGACLQYSNDVAITVE